jgi:FkbM family methyltransferase
LDIGANHPVFHSNTFFFYLRGWSGIAVEPNPDLCEEFRKIRPRDKVLNVAVAGQSSVVKYHRFADSFLNSISPEWGEYRIKGGEEYLGSCEIHCISPQDLLKHVETPIDFMNIDIEGVDAEVLSRWDWSACKPTVICAEILSLEIRDMLETDVAQILLAAGYRPASRGWQSAIFIADEAIRVYLEKITNPV